MIANELDRLAALHDSGKLSDDEYQRAKARVIEGLAPTPGPGARLMRRSRQERWLGGVCSGMARSVGLEAWPAAVLAACCGFALRAGALVWGWSLPGFPGKTSWGG